MRYNEISKLTETINAEKKKYDDLGGPRGIDHIGITVPDMDKAVKFLQDAFGAQIVYEMVPKGGKPRTGKKIVDHLAVPAGSKIIRQTLMRLGTGPSLELFQFSDVDQKPANMLQDMGLQHFTVFVDNMDKSVKAVKAAGGKLYYPPHRPDGPEGAPTSRGVYIQPPWGGIVELFHYDTIRYPDNSTVERWTPPAKFN